MIYSIAVAPKGETDVYKVYHLEIEQPDPDIATLANELFHDANTERIVEKMPDGHFLHLMYHNGVVDPASDEICGACRKYGVEVLAAKVAHRYYNGSAKGVTCNRMVQVWFEDKEPDMTTLRPRGSAQPIEYFDLTGMSTDELLALSKNYRLSMDREQMEELVKIQKEENIPRVSDVWLYIFAVRWSDHCNHTKWKKLGLFKILKGATMRIKNRNMKSAFIDNAGGWKFFKKLVAVLKGETHNSPAGKEAYGGQLTKIGGVIRDILRFALGAIPIGNIEMTAVGEFAQKKYGEIADCVLSACIIARDTVRAIRDYGNPMGIPMLLARMLSHPGFTGKPFALGITVGMTKEEFSHRGVPRQGDLAVISGGKTGNDGFMGALESSIKQDKHTDEGDNCHVQIGNPTPEQRQMRATRELRDKRCARAGNDFGAAGFPSAFGELGEPVKYAWGSYRGGVLINTAHIPLKCAGLPKKIVVSGESQERFAECIIPAKLKLAMKIYKKYGLEATVIGVFTGNGRLQFIDDPTIKKYSAAMPLSGEILFDMPYKYFDRCPLPADVKVIVPPQAKDEAKFPTITLDNVQEMGQKVVGHFDICNQKWATTQYDSTVQGISFQGPLWGKNYNIPSALAVQKPVYGKNYGLTHSFSYSPWQFDANPVNAAINAMLDAIVTQVVAGVYLYDICLADNFYTPCLDPYAYWYLREQVQSISDLSEKLRTPFITGKDSSSGSAEHRGVVINVPISVAIYAMGKIKDARQLRLHCWQSPGNYLYAIGRQAQSLGGSLLASALDIFSPTVDSIGIAAARPFLDKVERGAGRNLFCSAAPINCGGIFRRLFEGVEGSGLGVRTQLCPELFPESFGSALVEVKQSEAAKVEKLFGADALLVGEITDQPGISVQGRYLDYEGLFQSWNTTFEREVMRDVA